MKTGIIIPSYNEGNRLNTKAFISFIKSHNQYHLCFVNDGSKDNTLEVLEGMQKIAPSQISIIDVKKNSGKAAAVRYGAKYLYNLTNIDYIGFIDADLSTDFNDFKNLVKTLHENKALSLVYGSRAMSKNQIKKNAFRKVFSKIINIIVYFILGLPIKDTQCGAKVFRRNIIPVAYNSTFLTKWLFDIEIFIRLKNHFGAESVMDKMVEQALIRWVHVDDSKLGIKDALQIPYKLVSIWFSYNVLSPLNFSLEPFKTPQINSIEIIRLNHTEELIAA